MLAFGLSISLSQDIKQAKVPDNKIKLKSNFFIIIFLLNIFENSKIQINIQDFETIMYWNLILY